MHSIYVMKARFFNDCGLPSQTCVPRFCAGFLKSLSVSFQPHCPCTVLHEPHHCGAGAPSQSL